MAAKEELETEIVDQIFAIPLFWWTKSGSNGFSTTKNGATISLHPMNQGMRGFPYAEIDGVTLFGNWVLNLCNAIIDYQKELGDKLVIEKLTLINSRLKTT